MTYGIHHITAISSDPQNTYDFYSQILGLKLIKKSVNQDDRGTYHLFFGDEVGSPGVDLTFFPYQYSKSGKHGAGMVNEIMLAVPSGSLQFWSERLDNFSIKASEVLENPVGDRYIEFKDWDGQVLHLVETKRLNADAKVWKDGVRSKYAIHNFYGAGIALSNSSQSEIVIKDILKFTLKTEKAGTKVWENTNSDFANLLFISETDERSRSGAGTVHHIAFRVKTDQEQLDIIKSLNELGHNPTEVIDRYYFKSVYFREPGGVLFEIATDEPGFDVDESIEKLGERLALPPFIEDQREEIEQHLPVLKVGEKVELKSKMFSCFKHIEFHNHKDKTLILLHGTGGDEFDLLQIVSPEMASEFNVISLRGNVDENGMGRFFKRFAHGDYDMDSIEEEVIKLKEFIETYSHYREISKENLLFLGFSNGANMIMCGLISFPELFKKVFLLHPAYVALPHQDDYSHIEAMISISKDDKLITAEESAKVITLLEELGCKVEVFEHSEGHTVTNDELEWIDRNTRSL